MPRFRFKGITGEGVALDGELSAQSEREAARLLERRGLAVVDLQPATFAPERVGLRRTRAPGQRDLILAIHELATLLGAGVGLADAVAAQARSAAHPQLAAAFEAMSTALRSGQSFSQALHASGLELPPYVGVLVQSGERAGLLAKALADAAAQMEYDFGVRTEMRQALTYPAILVLAGLAAIMLMFTFVVPKFANLLERAEDLPLLAWIVLGGGMFARDNIGVLLVSVVLATAGVLRWLADPARRERALEWLERAPVLGLWRVEAETAGWARILSTLLGNKVLLMDALGLALAAVRSPRRRARLDEARRAVRGGMPLADAMEEQGALTSTGYNLIRVGERSGELPAMLASLARLCEEAGRARMKQFLALLEPIAILLIGSAIGLIMIGIILAITSANDLVI